jgi:hypothetical protein
MFNHVINIRLIDVLFNLVNILVKHAIFLKIVIVYKLLFMCFYIVIDRNYIVRFVIINYCFFVLVICLVRLIMISIVLIFIVNFYNFF